jgi:delta14-sterol reductase
MVLHYFAPDYGGLFLMNHYASCAVAGNLLGLVASYYFVYQRFPHDLSATEQKGNSFRRAPTRSIIPSAASAKKIVSTSESSTAPASCSQQPYNSFELDHRGLSFFYGKEFNPRWKIAFQWYSPINSTTHTILDVKMALYLIGAIVLELNVLSAVLYERTLRPAAANSNAMLVYATLMTWFVLDYLWYEEIHLYTYDIFAEKIGFKLLWGCMCFYPFFYPIGVLPILNAWKVSSSHYDADDLSIGTFLFICLLYGVGSS